MKEVTNGTNPVRRFPIRRAMIWRPFLLLLGAVESNSHIEIDTDQFRLSFGMYIQDISRDQIESVEHTQWAIWRGIGIRTGSRKRLGIIGSTEGVVQLKLRTPCVSFLGLKADTLFVSLDDPDGFIELFG